MADAISNIIQQFADLRVLVIGEAMLDSYVKGRSERLAPEAPVPVVAVTEEVNLPGGAANTAVNVRQLGAQVRYLSVIGDDGEGDLLLSALDEQDIFGEGVVRQSGRRTLLKRRVVAESQLLVRYDQGSTEPISREAEAELIRALERAAPEIDAVILSDYRYGILTGELIERITELQKQHGWIVVVDSKRLASFRGLELAAVKPNYTEAVDLLGLERLDDSAARVEQIQREGTRLFELLDTQLVVVTVDTDGALFFQRDGSRYRTYARPTTHNGVSGAGDTFISALTLALAVQTDLQAAAEIASAAAAIVVNKEGTSVCAADELKAHFSGAQKRVDAPSALAAQAAQYRAQGLKIVFTNGVFDILHSGHVSYLNQAKALGDVLILGLNADESVQRLKGPDRPINHLDERARVLSALSCVDHIIPFYENTPVEIIQQIRPDIYVKGGDYTRETLPEAPVVEALGGVVRILPYIQGQSTTHVIERIRQIYVDGKEAAQAGE